MADGPTKPICCSQLGPSWIDTGTNCLTQCSAPVTSGANAAIGPSTPVPEPPSFLESLRQGAVLGSILGIRKGIAQLTAMVNPLGMQAVTNDEMAVNQLQAQGNYEKAFEVATGFADYFEIHRQAKENKSSTGEEAAVMLGHGTGFNQAVETYKGETVKGDKLEGFARFEKGLDALLRLANTVMTVAGGVEATGIGSIGSGPKPKIVSPVYRVGEHDVMIVETSLGRQAFYRSTGKRSGNPGKWYPVDEFHPWDGHLFKERYSAGGPSVGKGGPPLHRLGTEEFKKISEQLGKMSVPKGAAVPGFDEGAKEAEQMTMNRILDFFGARIPPEDPKLMVRPVREPDVKSTPFQNQTQGVPSGKTGEFVVPQSK